VERARNVSHQRHPITKLRRSFDRIQHSLHRNGGVEVGVKWLFSFQAREESPRARRHRGQRRGIGRQLAGLLSVIGHDDAERLFGGELLHGDGGEIFGEGLVDPVSLANAKVPPVVSDFVGDPLEKRERGV
jgi:hypothetical protein